MAFTKYVALLIVAVFVAGCSQTPSTPAGEAAPAPKGAEAQASAAVEKPPAPNPYLTKAPNVSAKAKRLFDQATAAMRNKQWAQAEALLKDMQKSYPKFAGIQVNLAIVYRETNRLEEAKAMLESAIKTNPDNFDAYNQLAVLERQQGDFAAAESAYKTALERWELQPKIHRNLGILYELYMGRMDDALAHYEKAQSLLPTPDKKLAGWIKDVKRRLTKTAANQGNKS